MNGGSKEWDGVLTRRRFNILTSTFVDTNQNIRGPQFPSMQLSYSTADIERSVFYTPEYKRTEPSELPARATILVVHGDMFVLEEEAVPHPSAPLTEQSGLFRIIGLGK
jgi:hypothetical protein